MVLQIGRTFFISQNHVMRVWVASARYCQVLLKLAILIKVHWYLSFNFCFVSINIERFFMCLFATLLCLFFSISSLVSVLELFGFFLFIELCEFFIWFWLQGFNQIYILQIFLSVTFYFLALSFEWQKFKFWWSIIYQHFML